MVDVKSMANPLFLREEELRQGIDLLKILKITKQSLSRVLSQLVNEGYIDQTTDQGDRRNKLLTLTEKGVHLEHRLTENQRKRIARAYRAAGAEAVQGFREVMRGIIDPGDQERFEIVTPAMPAQRRSKG